MSRSVAAQPDVFAAYYLPISAREAAGLPIALRARTAIRRLYASVTRGL